MGQPDQSTTTWPPIGDDSALEIEQCHELGWTDGLPVLAPTRKRVDAMLGPWRDRHKEIVAVLPPTLGNATLEAIAANCVLAGCLPDHLPVVVAAIKAASNPRFNLDAVMTGLNAACPIVIVDGPTVEQLHFNADSGVLGAGNRSNAAVGRAVQLCIRNIGGAKPGELDTATHSHPGKYSFLVATSTVSPWPPLRIRLGYDSTNSIVVLKAADAPLTIADMGHDDPYSILRTIARSATIPGSYNAYFRQELWLIMSPEHAFKLSDAGMTPDSIAEFLHANSTIPAGLLRGHGLYGFVDESIPPTWLEDAQDDDPISIVDGPDRVHLLVAGGSYGGYTTLLLGQGVSVSERIDL